MHMSKFTAIVLIGGYAIIALTVILAITGC